MKEKYTLIELCEEFAAKDIGTFSAFIETLRSGIMQTCIYFPQYSPRKCPIPTSFWKKLPPARLAGLRQAMYLATPSSVPGNERTLAVPISFTVDSYDDASPEEEKEFDLLDTIADALRKRDVNAISKRYISLLEENDVDLSSPDEKMWSRIFDLYTKWDKCLDCDDEPYEVYVAHDDLPGFFELGEKGPPLNLEKRGRPASDAWEHVYRGVIISILRRVPGLSTQLKDIVEESRTLAVKQYHGDARNVPNPDTIIRKLRELGPRRKG